jgi:hypothetical protein
VIGSLFFSGDSNRFLCFIGEIVSDLPSSFSLSTKAVVDDDDGDDEDEEVVILGAGGG